MHRIYVRGIANALGFASLLLGSAPAFSQTYLGANLQPFVVLGATTVTCTGGGTFTGNIGVSPNTVAGITGFPALCTDIGVLQGAPAADPAQADLNTAIGILAARPCDSTIGPNLTGLTLVPGTYC